MVSDMQENTTQWRGQALQVAVPSSRDPFINTHLIPLGPGEDGVERFWISSWNSNSGTQGVLVDENGRERIYRFPLPHAGFYCCVQEDSDTLWLCGYLNRVVRLTLSSGEYEAYETGAPAALVFAGMAIDRIHKKLFAVAYPGKVAAFSFDYEKREPVKVYNDVYADSSLPPEKQGIYMRHHFANSDGTYNVVLMIAGAVLLRWNPENETVEPLQLKESAVSLWEAEKEKLEKFFNGDLAFITGENSDHYYLPYLGWFDSTTNQFIEGPKPERETKWFIRRGNLAWGWSGDATTSIISLWNLEDGSVRDLCKIPDFKGGGVCLSQNNKIVAMTIYGQFLRFDALTGEQEISRLLPTEAVGAVDCLCRIDEERLLGTPFITQRFWEANLKTGEGSDCGRAAPGVGEVLLTWNINQKIYMASYTEGILTEYDPQKPVNFGENPRVVAKAPDGMRPIAAAHNGETLYYSCSYHYGHLGCVLTQYNVLTGEAIYRHNPIPGLSINTWHYHEPSHSLIAGTTIHADCRSCPPTQEQSVLARLCPDTLEVLEVKPVSPKSWQALIYGQLNDTAYLMQTFGDEHAQAWHRVDSATLESALLTHPALEDAALSYIKYTGKPGYYVWKVANRFELWDMNRMERVMVLAQQEGVHLCHVQNESVYLVTQKEILILEDCLKGLPVIGN